MNKQQLVDAVGERLGDRRTAATAGAAVLDTVTGALADGEKVALFGFGVFERVERAARTARNPSTGGTVEVPATAVPRFRPGQGLKDAVSGGSPRPRRAAAAPPEPAAAEEKATKKKAKPEKSGKADTSKKGKAAKGKKAKGK